MAEASKHGESSDTSLAATFMGKSMATRSSLAISTYTKGASKTTRDMGSASCGSRIKDCTWDSGLTTRCTDMELLRAYLELRLVAISLKETS